jgi:putative ABC transport system substrate-binding protein
MLHLFISCIASAFAKDYVAVVVSDTLPEYLETAQSFIDAYPGSLETYQIGGNKTKAIRIMNEIQNDPPSMIFAVGTKAAYISIQQASDIPCFYVMVNNPTRYGIYGDNVMGITSFPTAEMTLSQLQLFVPKAQRLGLFMSSSSPAELISDAVEKAKSMGYEPIIIHINSNTDLRRELRLIPAKVDAIWLFPDPQIITPDNFHMISSMAKRSKIPVVTNSELLTQGGALFSVTPNNVFIGQQAASLMGEILEMRELQDEDIHIYYPEIPKIIFNETTQKTIGLELTPFANGFIDEFVQ